MTLYRDMTTPQLAQHGLHWKTNSPHERRMIFALASRLEQEYQRANKHRDKALEVQRLRIEQEHRQASYIKVAKPHIQQVFTVPENKGMWRCTGPFGTVQYGGTPQAAYQAWRRVMERGQGIPRKGK